MLESQVHPIFISENCVKSNSKPRLFSDFVSFSSSLWDSCSLSRFSTSSFAAQHRIFIGLRQSTQSLSIWIGTRIELATKSMVTVGSILILPVSLEASDGKSILWLKENL